MGGQGAGAIAGRRAESRDEWPDVPGTTDALDALVTPGVSSTGSAARAREAGAQLVYETTSYWSLNIAIAVPPAVTLTLRVFVAPEGGLQLTE